MSDDSKNERTLKCTPRHNISALDCVIDQITKRDVDKRIDQFIDILVKGRTNLMRSFELANDDIAETIRLAIDVYEESIKCAGD